MREPHPQAGFVHESLERTRIGEAAPADALDPEILRHARGPERARAVHLTHPPATDPAQERVAPDAWLRRHLCAACLVTVVLAAAGTAGAQDLEILVVRADPASRARADELAARIASGALGDDRRVIASPAVPAEAPPDGRWLDLALAEAEDRFAQLDLSGAVATLDGARSHLDERGADGASRDALVQLFLLRARVLAAVGDPSGELESVRTALSVSPELRVDLDRHPPALADRVEAERAMLRECPVALGLAPEDASVSVDGGPSGTAPDALTCGPHWLTVTAPAHRARSLAATLEPAGLVTQIVLEVEPAAVLRAAGPPFSSLPDGLTAAAAALGGSPLLLDLAVVGDRIDVALGDRRVSARATATADELLALLVAGGRAEPADDVAAIAAGTAIGIAAVVALVVTTVVLATAPGPSAFELRGHVLP